MEKNSINRADKNEFLQCPTYRKLGLIEMLQRFLNYESHLVLKERYNTSFEKHLSLGHIKIVLTPN